MTGSLFTLSDARSFVARFVEAGSCDQTTIDSRIYEALRRLMVKADWPYTTQTVRIRVNNQSFPLPRECESIRWANIENEAAGVFSQSYEFMASGPGEVKHREITSGLRDLVDMGYWPSMYDIPPVEEFAEDHADCTDRTLHTDLWKLVAFSTEQVDTTGALTLFGTHGYHNEVNGSPASNLFVPGESLLVNRWENGIEGTIHGPLSTCTLSTSCFRHLQSWKKPVTKGYISLYACNPENNYMYFLAKAHPDETVPVWRRYKVSGMALSGDASSILAHVKMKALKLTRADDILPIQNLDALKMMVIALREENSGNLQQAAAYEGSAVRLLGEQMQDSQQAGGSPVIMDYELEISSGSIVHPTI